MSPHSYLNLPKNKYSLTFVSVQKRIRLFLHLCGMPSICAVYRSFGGDVVQAGNSKSVNF